jgi:hypothetical protein
MDKKMECQAAHASKNYSTSKDSTYRAVIIMQLWQSKQTNCPAVAILNPNKGAYTSEESMFQEIVDCNI